MTPDLLGTMILVAVICSIFYGFRGLVGGFALVYIIDWAMTQLTKRYKKND
jgi:preprotein translocase subunit SecD